MEPKKNNGISRRSIPFEYRMEETEDGKRVIRGHGSVFNSLSQDLGGFREIIHTGAFDEALKGSDIRCLINHDANLILGRNTSGTLDVSIDETGLYYTCELPETSYARDLSVSLDRGDISQSSFAFSMDWEDDETHEYELREDGQWILHIRKVKELFDVSPVTYPAYTAADVRSAADHLEAAKQAHEARAQAAQEEKAEEDATAEDTTCYDQRSRRLKLIKHKTAF
jgi:HK97 family phage prohead protease